MIKGNPLLNEVLPLPLLTDRERMILKTCRPKSEFIKQEEPDIIARLDWNDIGDVHPFILGQKILKFLRKNNIPVIGEVDVEGVEKGRLYWDDYVCIGKRVFFYHLKE